MSLLLFLAPLAQADPYCVSHRGQTSATDAEVIERENTWLAIDDAICQAERDGTLPATGEDKACAPKKRDAYEGTPPALEQWETPLLGIEFDVWHTADGVGLLSHGEGTKSSLVETFAVDNGGGACPLTERLAETTWTTLSAACAPRYAEAGETMDALRLDNILDRMWLRNPHAVPVVELKDAPSPHTVTTLSAYAIAHPGALRVISFVAPALDRLRLMSTAPRSSYHLYLLAGELMPPYPALVAFDGVDISTRIPRDHQQLQRQGFVLGVWTANDEASIARALLNGVDFVTTDEPAMCEALLSADTETLEAAAAEAKPGPKR